MFTRMRFALTCALFGIASLFSVSSAQALVPPPKIIGPKLNHYHVQYRCPLPKDKVFANKFQAVVFANKLKSLGFSVKMTSHPGHVHVTYELDAWRQKIFFGPAGHAQAHALQNFLKSIGCQTNLIHH